MHRVSRAAPALLVFSAAFAAPMAAQCEPAWLPGNALQGVGLDVHAVTRWDPDGAGPAAAVYAVGGNFEVAGGVLANGIATWDPATGEWSELGGGMTGAGFDVRTLLALPNGDLIAGGHFATSGGVPTNGIARWNGAAWQPLGGGLTTSSTNPVESVVALPNGELVACGSWSTAGGYVANGVARWDGTSWSQLGGGVQGRPSTLLVRANGDVLVGGRFGTFGNMPDKILRWDGTAWSVFASGAVEPLWHVASLLELANGDLLAGGYFRTLGGVEVNGIARWNGSTWLPLGPGLLSTVNAMGLNTAGDVIVAVGLQVGRWDGSLWWPVGPATNNEVECLATGPGGEIVAGGRFTTIDGAPLLRVGRWNGAAWTGMGAGGDGAVHALARLPGGDLVVGGEFTRIEGVAAARIARRTPAGWVPLGAGFDGTVRALAVLANGELVAGGEFTHSGGVATSRLARWNGTGWSQLSSGTNGPVKALAIGTDGRLLVGGQFTVPSNAIVAWNGIDWLAYGTGVDAVGLGVNAIAALPGGQLVIGGSFQTVSGTTAFNLARWTGSSWASMGVQSSIVHALLAQPDGSVIVGADSGVRRWDGAGLQSMGGTGLIARALAALPNGDMVVGGSFPTWNVARWDGSAWQAFSPPPLPGTDGEVLTLLAQPDGSLALGGRFTRTADQPAAFLGTLSTTCPSAAVPYGSACSGSAGPLTLTHDAPPWVGGPLRTTTTGFANNAFGRWHLGLAASAIALPPLLPQAGAGCELLSAQDVLSLLVFPTGGSVTVSIPVPNDPVFAGLVLYHQVGQIEVDPVTFAISGISTTNGLQLTLGAL
ncbi:MAG: hypothetical protein AB7O97_23080 [Planctomycetota bacterium]